MRKIKKMTINIVERLNFKKIQLFGCLIQFNFTEDKKLGCIYITHLKSSVCHYIDIYEPSANDYYFDNRYKK